MFKKRAIGSASRRRVQVESLQEDSSVQEASEHLIPNTPLTSEPNRINKRFMRATQIGSTDAEARVQTLNDIAGFAVDQNCSANEVAESDPKWEADVLARAGYRSSNQVPKAPVTLTEAQNRVRAAIGATEERVKALEAEIVALDWQISERT